MPKIYPGIGIGIKKIINSIDGKSNNELNKTPVTAPLAPTAL